MKVVLLAGGLGTRLSEETIVRPKPLVEIGGMPILWHIMKIFSLHGFNEFIICVGYKGYMIKEYFANYALMTSNVKINVGQGTIELEKTEKEPWLIHIIDTGLDTMTGGRIKMIIPYLEGDSEFFMTYGDGVANIDLNALVTFHHSEARLATVTGAQPPGRFGQLGVKNNSVATFVEKPHGEAGWVNAGFFILPSSIGDYIDLESTTFEKEPLDRLTRAGQLSLYRHYGFWLPMDTLRDKHTLDEMWRTGEAPWATWQ